MRRALTALAVVAAVGGSATIAHASNSGDPGGRPLQTTLTDDQEVEPFVDVEGASGDASFRLNPGRQQVCVELTTQGFDPLVLAHIHEGVAGENGGVVVDFTDLIDGSGASGCVSADRAVIVDIIRDPAGYYVNLHQGMPPEDGFFDAIRGQLGR